MSEYNLCSALVHVKQGQEEEVSNHLQQQQGVEVHAVTDDGRLIVTVEGEKRKVVGDQIMEFYNIDGVLSASMIYQFSDDLVDDAIEQETVELKPSEERVSA